MYVTNRQINTYFRELLMDSFKMIPANDGIFDAYYQGIPVKIQAERITMKFSVIGSLKDLYNINKSFYLIFGLWDDPNGEFTIKQIVFLKIPVKEWKKLFDETAIQQAFKLEEIGNSIPDKECSLLIKKLRNDWRGIKNNFIEIKIRKAQQKKIGIYATIIDKFLFNYLIPNFEVKSKMADDIINM